MSRYLSACVAVGLTAFVSFATHAQPAQSPRQCVSKLATTSSAFLRAAGTPPSLVVVSKNLDSAFKYMQAAESLARLLPPNSKSAFVIDESVVSANWDSMVRGRHEIDECEKWAKQVYAEFSSNVREEIYASAKERVTQLIPRAD